jgi:2-dehydropantoate 2-reductase
MRLVFGELSGGKSARGEAFLSACQAAGFDATHSDHIRTELWLKFIILATNSGITAATRTPIGKLRDDPDIAPVIEAATREAVAVGKAAGVPLPDDVVERSLAFTRNAPPDMMASMAHDLLRGGRIELPWLAGKVVALGRELGVPTPVNSVLYAVLKPFVSGG